MLPKDRPLVTDLLSRLTAGLLRNTSVSRGARVSLALGAAALGIAVASRYRRRYTFENKVVVVTGGSRGLGLVARELVHLPAAVEDCGTGAERDNRHAGGCECVDAGRADGRGRPGQAAEAAEALVRGAAVLNARAAGKNNQR